MGLLYSLITLIPLLIFPRQEGCGRNGVFARIVTLGHSRKLYFCGCTRICPILSHLVVPGSGFVCCIACLPFLPAHHNLQRMSTFLCVITFFFRRTDADEEFNINCGLDLGVSENSVPLNPMVLLIIIPIKWLFHWEYTQYFQTNPSSYSYICHKP